MTSFGLKKNYAQEVARHETGHETGPQICSFCHAVSAFAVLKKVSCGRINVSSDIFKNRLSYGLWSFPRVSAIIGVCETSNK